MPIKQSENCEHGHVPNPKDDHQLRNLIGRVDHAFHRAVWQTYLTVPTGKLINEERKDEFQRIDVKENDKQQHPVENNREIIRETIMPKEFVLIEPNYEQERE